MCVLPARGLAGWHRCWDRRDCVLATPRLAPCQPVQLGSRGWGGPVPSQSAGSPVAPPSGLWGSSPSGPRSASYFLGGELLSGLWRWGWSDPTGAVTSCGWANKLVEGGEKPLYFPPEGSLGRVDACPWNPSSEGLSLSWVGRSPSFPLSATGLLSHEECVVATTPVPKAKGDSPPLVQACFDPSSFHPGPVGAPGRWSAL